MKRKVKIEYLNKFLKQHHFWVREAMQALAKVWKYGLIFLRKRSIDTTKMKT